MTTAASTPRLGLMLPTDSDDFTPDDFVDTFTKLDGKPGVTPVSNFAALPTGLSSAQHGSCFVQTDNGSMWLWNRPGSAAGTWMKINTCGLLQSASQASSVSTPTNVEASGPTVVSANYTDPGGRSKLIAFHIRNIRNDGVAFGSRVTLWHDNVLTETSIAYGSTTLQGVSHHILSLIGPQVAGSTHSIKITMSSVGTGTSTTADTSGSLFIWEI